MTKRIIIRPKANHSRGRSFGHLPEVRKLVETFFVDVEWEVDEPTTAAQVRVEYSLSISLGNLRNEPNGVKGDEDVDFLFVIADEMTDYSAYGQFCQINGLLLYDINLDVFLDPEEVTEAIGSLKSKHEYIRETSYQFLRDFTERLNNKRLE